MNVRYLLLLPLLLACAVSVATAGYCNNEDSWVPVGEGVPEEAECAAVFNGELHVLYPEENGEFAHDWSLTLASWDGFKWRVRSRLVARDAYGDGYNFTVYKDKLYLIGPFWGINDIPGTVGIAAWNGTNWESVGGGTNGTVYLATVYAGELYVAGSFTATGTDQPRNIARAGNLARFDGASWRPVGSSPSFFNTGVQSLTVSDGRLFVTGMMRLSDMPKDESTNTAVWDGKSWNRAGEIFTDIRLLDPGKMVVYRGKLYMAGEFELNGVNEKMAVYDDGRWHGIPVPDSMPTLRADLVVIDDLLFLSTLNTGNVPGGALWTWDGAEWKRRSDADDPLGRMRFVKYAGWVYGYGSFSASCGTPLRNVARLCTRENCSGVAGFVYQDFNGDCVKDPEEPGVGGRIIEILPGPFYARTNPVDGSYFRFIPNAGNHTVALVPHMYWNRGCPAGSLDAELSGDKGVVENLNFSTTPIPGIRDMRVSLAGGRPRPGFPHTYTIRYENIGTEPLTGAIRFRHDPGLIYDSSRVREKRYSPAVAEWDFVKLPVGLSGTIRIYMTVPASMPRGAEVCAEVSVELRDAVEETLEDNRESICDTVRGSYDPNDIAVSPEGDPNDELGRLSPKDSILTYTIRFQNTGTDTAFRVVVVDTLDLKRLEMTTLRLGASSHPYELEFGEGGELRFVFRDIMLPDSNASEVESHGYLKYSIRVKQGLKADEMISNRVAIYFDYNAPVLTNTVVSITGEPEVKLSAPGDVADGASVLICPNPIQGKARIVAEMSRGAAVTVSTLLGRQVDRRESDGSGEMILDLSGLETGAYIVRVETRKGIVSRRLDIVR